MMNNHMQGKLGANALECVTVGHSSPNSLATASYCLANHTLDYDRNDNYKAIGFSMKFFQ